MLMDNKQFLARVEAHLKRTKVSPSRFGKEAVGDPSFVFELRKGRSPSLGKVNKIMAIIDAAAATDPASAA